jgi:hypothetical protein
MLHPETRGRRVPRAAYAAAALFALALAVYLTYAGIDYAVNGCGCEGAASGDWFWAAMLAVAVGCYGAAVALALRAASATR